MDNDGRAIFLIRSALREAGARAGRAARSRQLTGPRFAGLRAEYRALSAEYYALAERTHWPAGHVPGVQ